MPGRMQRQFPRRPSTAYAIPPAVLQSLGVRASVVFLPDCPNWSFDAVAQRLLPYIPGAQVHYLVNHPAANAVPRGDVYFYHHWVSVLDAIQRGIYDPSGKNIVVIPDRYWHLQHPEKFARVMALKPIVLSMVPDAPVPATFCPFPVSPAFLQAPRDYKLRTQGKLRVGMVSNGYRHATDDHKGDQLAHRIIDKLPWCEIQVAGTDFRLLPSEMQGWYDKLDVFMSLSVSEGCSGAIADAIALGVPVIGTPVGPLDPFCNGGYLQVDRDQPETVLAALRHARVVLSQGRALPTARGVAAAWSADTVAQTICRVAGVSP